MGRPEPLGGSPSPDLHKLPTPVRMAMDVEANQSTSPEELLRRHTSHRDSAGQRSSERASDNEDNRSETSEEKVEDESYTTQKRMMRLMRSTVVVATSRTHQVSLLQSCLRYPGKSWRAFKKRGYIISHESSWVNAWDWCLMILILYTAIIAPLVLVFEELRWDLGSIDYDSFANVRAPAPAPIVCSARANRVPPRSMAGNGLRVPLRRPHQSTHVVRGPRV